MHALILLVFATLVLGCVGNPELFSKPTNTPVPENYSALFSAENYSIGEIKLNISHPMMMDNFRWGEMPIKIFLDKAEMRELDLQDLKKSRKWK